MPMPTPEIPGLKEAIEREQQVRDYAVLRLPHEVCGIQINPLRLRDYILLSSIRNPFIAGGYKRKVDAAQLIWLLSTTYLAPTGGFLQRIQSRLRRSALMWTIGKIEEDELIAEVDEFLDEMFMDAPGGSANSTPPCASFGAELIHLMHERWTREELLNMPLPELWQYLRCMGDPKAPKFNKFSDRAKAQFLEEMNNG